MFNRVTRAIGAAAVAAISLAPILVGQTAEAIVGGVAVPTWIYPAYVRIVSPTLCGGTVIAPDTIMTAAHCVDAGTTPAQVTVLVSDVSPRSATAITVHPLWNGNPDDGHDVAIVRLTAGATAGVTPVQVGSPWNTSYYAPNTPATIVGHGRTSPGSQASAELRAVDTVLRSDAYMDDVYNSWFGFDHWNEPLMIGAGSTTQTVCHGDSGGPLFVDKNGTWTWIQVGVASFVETWPDECAEPGGFTELRNAQLAWVAQNVPSVTAAWGPCTTSSGYPGQSAARYVSWFLPGAYTDGPFYWEITCNATPPPPPPTTTVPPTIPPSTTTPPTDTTEPPPITDPAPEPDPTIPPMCRRKPWLCEDF